MKIAEVALKVPLHRNFDYVLDAQLHADASIGSRVKVSFSGRALVGVIVAIKSESDFAINKLKPITELVDQQPIINPKLLELIQFASTYYHFPLGESFHVALPSLLNKGEQPDKSAIIQLKLDTENPDEAKLKGKKQKQLLNHLIKSGTTPLTELKALGFASATIKSLQKQSLVTEVIEYHDNWRHQPLSLSHKPMLNNEQAVALASINQSDGFSTFLLEGVTGSGKTEVYLQALEKIIEAGQQALVLVPEIGLTPQTVNRFRRRFRNTPIMLWHSALTDSERLQTWRQCETASCAIVIGTRSGIFLPFKSLGMIIVDEEHDSSFKQQDSLRYHARDLAVFRAHQHHIPLVLGTATPALETLNKALTGKFHLLPLSKRAQTSQDNHFELLDMRAQPEQAGLANASLAFIDKELKRNKQVMVFLNRRGFSPTLICHECAWVSQCPRCSTSATYHKHIRNLICHHCGEQSHVPHQCPECGSTQIVPVGKGTEQLEEFLSEYFPDTPITRIDRDSTRKKGSLEQALEEINEAQPRILIGTQMLAKGHHFAEVSLVVIIDVDAGLYSYDFRATEHLAQLITQVAGRAGRSGEPGTVLLQTHFPEHPLLQDLVNNGYQDFARYALTERQETMLPPYTNLAILRCEAHQLHLVLNFLQDLIPVSIPSGIQLLGPIPAPLERVAGKYRYQLHIQSQERNQLHQYVAQLIEYITQQKITNSVRWNIDIDPLTLN